jgi:hypothetical protein
MHKDTTNSKRTRFRRGPSRPSVSKLVDHLSHANTDLSEDEIDRRAWATANRMPSAPVPSRSGRGKSK